MVGAYRLGQVDLILDRFGKKGLYTNTLFDLKDGFLEHVSQGIELGRSFVREEYQRLYSPLLLLWKGIALFVAANPRYSMLFGPVTISSAYSDLSRRLHGLLHDAQLLCARAGAVHSAEDVPQGQVPEAAGS